MPLNVRCSLLLSYVFDQNRTNVKAYIIAITVPHASKGNEKAGKQAAVEALNSSDLRNVHMTPQERGYETMKAAEHQTLSAREWRLNPDENLCTEPE